MQYFFFHFTPQIFKCNNHHLHRPTITTSTVSSAFHHHHQLPFLSVSRISQSFLHLRFSNISAVDPDFRPSQMYFQHFAYQFRSGFFAASNSPDSYYIRILVEMRKLKKRQRESKNGVYIVGDFMTRKEELHVVKPTTTVDEALEALVEHRITGFPVIDENLKLVGLVSDYDLLALDSISGTGRPDTDMFPEVDSTWKTFNEVQKLLSKTNGKLVGDVMASVPVVVRESTNLEDAARLLLETKYRQLPVVDGEGRLVGIITRGNVVGAALQMKRETNA